MHALQPITRHVHEDVMLGVEMHPVGRDQQALDRVRQCRARMGERIVLGVDARVFGDVAQAGDEVHAAGAIIRVEKSDDKLAEVLVIEKVAESKSDIAAPGAVS